MSNGGGFLSPRHLTPSGQGTKSRDLPSLPPPVQQPGPPVHIGGAEVMPGFQ
jgi:hypothetical protein